MTNDIGVIRGGGCVVSAANCRCARRFGLVPRELPGERFKFLGFRVVKEDD